MLKDIRKGVNYYIPCSRNVQFEDIGSDDVLSLLPPLPIFIVASNSSLFSRFFKRKYIHKSHLKYLELEKVMGVGKCHC